MMYTGFRMSTKAGISFCLDDIMIPAEKATILEAAEAKVKDVDTEYNQGLTTGGERKNRVIDIWSRANDDISKEMMVQIGSETAISAPPELQGWIAAQRAEEHTSELQTLMSR